MADLFQNLARTARRLLRQGHRGPGGAGAGAPAPRHVYRRHRRAGAAPSGRRGARQRHGRGGGRPRRPASRSSLHADDWVTVRDNGRGIPIDPHPEVPGQVGAGGDPHHAAFGRQVRRQGLRRPRAACTASASRWSTRCPTSSTVEVARDRSSVTQAYARGKPIGEAEERRARSTTGAAPPSASIPTREIFGDSAQFRPGAALPHGALQGLSLPRRRDPLDLRRRAAQATATTPAEAVLHFPGGLVDFLAARHRAAARP